jgi:ribonuclease HI
MKELTIYSDGGSFNNGYKDPDKPMYGSYGSIIVRDGEIIHEYSDWYENMTNNQGELYGFIKAYMQFLKGYKSNEPYTITVVSDSQYLINGVNKYLNNWKKKDWHTASGDDVKNKNMWKIIDFLINFNPNIKLIFKWQKGHKGKTVSKEENIDIYFNEHCDSIATEQISFAVENGGKYFPPDVFENIIDSLVKLFNIN